MNGNIITIIHKFLPHVVSEETVITTLYDEEIGLVKFALSLEDPSSLIGRNGEALRALNYLVRKVAEKEFPDTVLPNFTIDINDYYGKNIEEIKTKAKIIADRAISFNRSIELEPMSAYDRLITHSYLSNFPDIITESTGEGKERRVVVKVKDN